MSKTNDWNETICKTEATRIYREVESHMSKKGNEWNDHKLEQLNDQIEDAEHENPFYNNGQFNEAEQDLLHWGLEELLKSLSKKGKMVHGEMEYSTETQNQLDDTEILIDKLQEGW